MATLDEQIEADAAAERGIESAVAAALNGDLCAFDQLRELEAEARHRWKLRLAEAPAGIELYSGSSGLALR